MSWLEENEEREYADYMYADFLTSKLNEEGIEKIYNEFEENKYFLIGSILKQWKEGKRLSEKQVICIAYFLANNGLGEWLD